MLRYAEILRYAERKIIDKAASQSLSFIKPIMYVMSDLNQILLFVLLFEHFSCASPTRITNFTQLFLLCAAQARHSSANTFAFCIREYRRKVCL